MLEGVLDLRVERLLVDQLGGDEHRQRRGQLLRAFHDPPQHPLRELPADHRRRLQQRLLGIPEPVDAGLEHGLHRGRDRDLVDLVPQPVDAALAPQRSALGQRVDDLLDEERIAARALADPLGEAVERRIRAEQVAQQLVGGHLAQRRQRDLAVGGLLHPARVVAGPQRGEDKRPCLRDSIDVVLEVGLADLVEPVEILVQVDGGRPAGARLDQPPPDREELAQARLRIHPRRRALGIGHSQEVEDERQVLPEGVVEEQEPAGDLLARRLLGVALGDPEHPPNELEDGQEGDPPGVRDAVALEDRDPLGAAPLDELVAQPALADPRLAHDPYDGASALERRAERRLERRELIAAADEAREPSRAGDVEPRAQRPGALEPEDPGGFAHALELERAEVA